MSKEHPLTSNEILDRAENIVDMMRTDDDLTNAEVVMVLGIAKMMQVQAITLDVQEDL